MSNTAGLPDELIAYALSVVRSGYREVPRNLRASTYLGKCSVAADIAEDGTSCHVTITADVQRDPLEPATELSQALSAQGELICRDGQWDEAKINLSLIGGSGWNVHHQRIEGEPFVEVQKLYYV